VKPDEGQQGSLHQVARRVGVVFRQVDVGQPNVGAMVELGRRELAGFELRLKDPIFR
jgi:hypothetical protein